MSPVDIALIVGAFVLILTGAEVFTNGVEWLGLKLRISEGATGSILAALGTATPETLIPVVAILFTNTSDSDEIGVGAILGAPFMLGTLVLLLIGVTAFVLRKKRRRATLHVDAPHALRDLSFFLVLYAIALGLALLPPDLHVTPGADRRDVPKPDAAALARADANDRRVRCDRARRALLRRLRRGLLARDAFQHAPRRAHPRAA